MSAQFSKQDLMAAMTRAKERMEEYKKSGVGNWQLVSEKMEEIQTWLGQNPCAKKTDFEEKEKELEKALEAAKP